MRARSLSFSSVISTRSSDTSVDVSVAAVPRSWRLRRSRRRSRVAVASTAGRGRFDRSCADARPWLYGIAANLLRHEYRSETRRLRAFARSGVDPLANDEPSLDRLEAAALAPFVAAALAE